MISLQHVKKKTFLQDVVVEVQEAMTYLLFLSMEQILLIHLQNKALDVAAMVDEALVTEKFYNRKCMATQFQKTITGCDNVIQSTAIR